jgi:hypothetical protein
MQLHTVLVGRPTETEQDIRALVARYVTESTEDLTALDDHAARGPQKRRGLAGVPVETERPAALAAALLQEVVSDAAV